MKRWSSAWRCYGSGRTRPSDSPAWCASLWAWGRLRKWLVGAIVVLIVSTLLNAAYFLPIVYAAFFRPLPEGDAVHGEAPMPILIALVATASMVIALFFFADLPLHLARQVAGLPG